MKDMCSFHYVIWIQSPSTTMLVTFHFTSSCDDIVHWYAIRWTMTRFWFIWLISFILFSLHGTLVYSCWYLRAKRPKIFSSSETPSTHGRPALAPFIRFTCVQKSPLRPCSKSVAMLLNLRSFSVFCAFDSIMVLRSHFTPYVSYYVFIVVMKLPFITTVLNSSSILFQYIV